MPSCRLFLPASFVSLAHAMIRWTGEFWEVRDLGSTNGTYLDGVRLTAGESVRILRGSRLAFGDQRESWRLTNDHAPTAAAIPLDGGEPRFFMSGAIALPGPSAPVASIFMEGDDWVLELEDAKIPLTSGQHFVVAAREWRFECPSAATSTYASSDALYPLADVTLIFGVSADEEHVTLSLRCGRAVKHLGERTCFYLALVLARQRVADAEGTASEEAGWIDVQSLLRMVPEYSSYSALNVEIFRFRRLLTDAGVRDAARSVERRRGQVRLGTLRVEVQKSRDRPDALVDQP